MNLLIVFFFSLSLAFPSSSMKIGEKLKYNAYFGGVPAAEASLEIIGKEKLNGTSTYHVRFSAKSIVGRSCHLVPKCLFPHQNGH